MGTRLVPSIENIEGCYKYGGEWDADFNVCWDHKDSDYGETAPIKGIRFGYQKYDESGGQWPSVWAMIDSTHDEIYYDDELGYGIDPLTLVGDILSDINEDRHAPRFWHCFTPRGRPISCNAPNAVFGPERKGRLIAESFRRHFGEKQLEEWLKNDKKKRKT